MGDKYVFIDRDGVVNKDGFGWTEYGYITRWEDFEFLPRVLDAFKVLAGAGYRSVVISNQKCVGKGIMEKKELDDITSRFIKTVRDNGGDISGVFYCTHTNEDNCDCRKPKKGLFIMAKEELGIKGLGDQFFIGDSERDIQAGKAAGLKTILVLSGKSSRKDAESWQDKPDHICEDLLEAVRLVIEQDKGGNG